MGNAMNTVVATGATAGYGGEAVQLSDHVRAVYAREIAWQAQPLMHWMKFIQQKVELGTEPGLTIQMMTLNLGVL